MSGGDTSGARSSERQRRVRWSLSLALFLFGAAAVALAWGGARGRDGLGSRFLSLFRRTGSSRPFSLAESSPHPNARPGVKYVGDAACARCHSEISDSYRRHPMGRSLAPIGSVSMPGEASGASPSFQAQGLEYSVERRGDRVLHREIRRDAGGTVVSANEADARYVIGSGKQAMAYLLERGDGYLIESPITWYSGRGRWDLSPGYEADNPHFERMVKPACLFCHSNQFDHVDGTENRYRQPIFQGHAIGCERCHGPGELHVKRPEPWKGEPSSIVNPAGLSPDLREAVCQQCHLQGDVRIVRAGRKLTDFRPGLPLHAIESVFVRPDPARNSRFFGQVEQMQASRCFRESRGRMGCISCHDPHELPNPEVKDAYYRERCLNCHAERGCALPEQERRSRSGGESCTVCHMPRSSNEQIPHTATTSHWIPRFAQRDTTVVLSPGAQADRAGPPLVHFHHDLLDERGRAQASRDLGIALASGSVNFPGLTSTAVARMALPLLDDAITADDTDELAFQGKGRALWRLGRREEALLALRKALALSPEREETLVLAGSQEAQMGRRDEALADLGRAIQLNPWRADYHQALSLIHAQRRDWDAAIAAARDCLQLNPLSHEARMLLIEGLIRSRKLTEAKREFQTLVDLQPRQLEAIEAWFARCMAISKSNDSTQ